MHELQQTLFSLHCACSFTSCENEISVFSSNKRGRDTVFAHVMKAYEGVPQTLVLDVNLRGTFAKLRKASVNFMPVSPRGTTRLPLDGFSLYLSFFFSKISRENSRFH